MLSSNHPSKHAPAEETLCIWIFHDGRPGHLSQLEGLANRILFHQESNIHWFDINVHKLRFPQFFFLSKFWLNQSPPDLIIGAGHRTHLSVLIAGFKLKAFTTLIMKPSLPHHFFDAVICPKHDQLKDSKKLLSTTGTINKIIPPSIYTDYPSRHKHIMLIGGPSKHFVFDETSLIRDIKTICQQEPDKIWDLSNSPRTPATFMVNLQKLCLTNLRLHRYSDNSFADLNSLLQQSYFTWVTPDSMSMLYESLSSGSRTAVFDMPFSKKKKPSRIAKQIQQLINEGTVLSFKTWKNQHPRSNAINLAPNPILWEADRAALWLLERLREGTK